MKAALSLKEQMELKNKVILTVQYFQQQIELVEVANKTKQNFYKGFDYGNGTSLADDIRNWTLPPANTERFNQSSKQFNETGHSRTINFEDIGMVHTSSVDDVFLPNLEDNFFNEDLLKIKKDLQKDSLNSLGYLIGNFIQKAFKMTAYNPHLLEEIKTMIDLESIYNNPEVLFFKLSKYIKHVKHIVREQ
ncbi:hypothetical protein [Apilactobacillus timberlakei]|uniref:hypothetical protein n=1 Tax=Apilactobacillus timberlakei TaxID=2008380 RepID=UPI00112EBB2A|nr:hypothetical protein [Apilactobacillus timberlakei]TPR16701.1 hypothetical protein DYZ95_06905 [Apilactobacillus timberlakei]TPR21563.1 hypothetical protein DY083_05955 [Apilactobacillus timberlakei]